MKRETVTRLLALVLVLLVGWWLATATEWAEEEVDTPPKGEAARNPFFAAQLVLQNLGVHVERRTGLDTMPPAGATLLLASRHWDLFPGREERLRQWVESGGNLVLQASMVDDEDLEWLPVVLAKRPRPNEDERPRTPRGPRREEPDCRTLRGTAAEEYVVCTPMWGTVLEPARGATGSWQAGGASGVEALRVPFGKGSVTVTGPWALLRNNEVLRTGSDHARLMVTALQARAGAPVWIVAEESREPLLRWLWQQGWIAVLLALAALAAWVWRSVVRFGPVGVVPPPQRRSMVEQVTGTGAFLRHHGPAALHAAEARALLETARRRLPGFARLKEADAAAAIARATGFRAADLQQALRPLGRGAALSIAQIESLELARRRLEEAAQPSPRTTP